MTDKVQKIREEVERLKGWNNNVRNSTRHMTLQEEDFNRGKHSSYLEILNFIDSLQEETMPKFKAGYHIKPIDSCLGSPRTILEVCDGWYVTNLGTLDFEYEDNWELVEEPVSEELEEAASKYGKDTFVNECMENGVCNNYDLADAFKAGAKWQKAHNWKPADGDDLPEIDREVIALLDNGKVVFAHRPPEYWDGKNIITGKVTRNYPKTYDKGGWNIPDIKCWLDVELPKEIEL